MLTVDLRKALVPYPVSVVDTGTGSYEGSYHLEDGGVYSLALSFGPVAVAESPWVLQVLEFCDRGAYAVETIGPCELCAPGSYNEFTGATACLQCPPKTTRCVAQAPSFAARSSQCVPLSERGAFLSTNCTCLSNFFSRNGPGTECVLCPPGGDCPGGELPPRSKYGFYPQEGNPFAFSECPRRASCLGDGKCAEGYTGRQCSSCSKGFYQIANTCYRCRSSRYLWLIAILFILLAFVFCAVLTWLNTADRRLYGVAAFIIGFNSLQISGAEALSCTKIPLCLTHLTLRACVSAAAIFGNLQLDWPKMARVFFDAISFFNFNLDLAVRCACPRRCGAVANSVLAAVARVQHRH